MFIVSGTHPIPLPLLTWYNGLLLRRNVSLINLETICMQYSTSHKSFQVKSFFFYKFSSYVMSCSLGPEEVYYGFSLCMNGAIKTKNCLENIRYSDNSWCESSFNKNKYAILVGHVKEVKTRRGEFLVYILWDGIYRQHWNAMRVLFLHTILK